MTRTPVIADSESIETLKLAEDLSLFFEDQKLKAQHRIRECESFLNNVHLPSKSVKEGLLNLRQNAEDDYSTLLHLERVLNMRNGGDFVPNLETQIVSPPKITTAFSNKASGQATLSSSGDHIGLSGGGSHLTKNARISIGSADNNLSSYIDDDHGEGKGFEMGMKLSEEQSLYSDLDENFDPLQYEAREAADMNNRQNCDIPLTNTKHVKTNADDISEQVKDNVDPCEEEDEEEDDFVQKESTRAFRIGIRQQNKTNAPNNMARSLPVSVPFPEGLPKRGEIFDLPSDDDEEENFPEAFQDSSKNSKDIFGRRRSAIPDKIAQIAKSMYDRDGLGFGESPH